MYDYLESSDGIGFPVTRKKWGNYFGVARITSAYKKSEPEKIYLTQYRRNKALLSGHFQLQENNIPCDPKRKYAQVPKN